MITTMSKIEPTKNATKPEKTRLPSKRVRHAIDLYVSRECKTQKDAAEKAGLTRERFCRALKEGHVQEYLGEKTRVLLSQSKTPAALTLMTLLEQAKSEHVRKDVATTLLGYNGYHANPRNGPTVSVGIQNAGYIIHLGSDGNDDVISEVGPVGGVIYDRERDAKVKIIDGVAHAAETEK